MKSHLKGQQVRSLLLGGILPVLLFTVIEESFGTLWGLTAGMAWGLGEILWELYSVGKVSPITWGGNGVLLILGGISWVTQEGIWFKLQPAILELFFAFVLWGTWILRKPLLWGLMQKQGGFGQDFEKRIRPGVLPVIQKSFSGMTLRLGVFFFIHAALATWAALYWSTTAWATLKGVGFTVSLLVYWVVESVVLRYRISSIHE